MEFIERLQSIIAYAKEEIPFYSRLYADIDLMQIKSADDLNKLPFITAEDLIAHFDELRSVKEKMYRVTSSSGTLGRPKIIYRTKSDSKKSIDVLEDLLRMAGVTKEDVVFIGQPFDMAHFGYLVMGGCEQIGAMAIPAGIAMSNEKYVSLIQLYKPSVICSSLSRVVAIIQLLQESRIKSLPYVKKIILAGEPLIRSGVEKIREYFHTVPFNFYGSEETDGLAGDCIYHTGLHFFNDSFYLELLEMKSIRPVKKGNRVGEAVITSLYQKGVPLIRYRLGDIVEVEHTKCQCDSDRPLIHVYGRANDSFTLFDGITIMAYQIEAVINQCFSDMINYQIVLSTLVPGIDEICIRLEQKHSSENYDEEQFVNALWNCTEDLNGLRETGQLKITISVNQGNIVVTPRGKTMKVIDLRNKEDV